MNIQKFQVCLLAIIAVALVYIAAIFTISCRYVPAAHPLTTLDKWTGNIYMYNGEIFYLHKNGYSTHKIDWRDYAGTAPKPNKQMPYSQEEIDFAKKNMGKKGTDIQDYLVQDAPSTDNSKKNIVDEILKGN